MRFSKFISIAALLLFCLSGFATGAPTIAARAPRRRPLPYLTDNRVYYCIGGGYTISAAESRTVNGQTINCAHQAFAVAPGGRGRCAQVLDGYADLISAFRPMDRNAVCAIHTSADCSDADPTVVGYGGISGNNGNGFGDNTNSFACGTRG